MQSTSIKNQKSKIINFLLMFILFLGAQHAFSQGKIYAVLVGVSEHQDPSKNLDFSHRDATEMYHLLKKHSSPDRIKLLTNSEARHDNIVRHAQNLFHQAKPEDMVIFFFSGHGNENGFVAHDKNLTYTTLQTIFKDCAANRKMIFADACRSGSLRQPGESGRQATSNNQNVGADVMLFLSSRSDQTSWEYSNLKNGMFTYFLISGLSGKADANKDNLITAIELFNYVNPNVKKKSDGTQTPVMWGNFDKNMVILKKVK